MKSNSIDFIITNLAEKYSIGFFPRLNNGITDYDFSHKLAICLSWSVPLHRRVSGLQKEHHISTHKVALSPSLDDLLAIAGEVAPEINRSLSDEAVKLCFDFGLPIQWRLSLMFLFLTNSILMVPSLPKISLYTPHSSDDMGEPSISISSILNQDRIRSHPIKDSVAIYFNARTSSKEIAIWLKEHSSEFEQSQNMLPAYKHTGITNADLRTLEGGELAWIIRDCYGFKSWAKVIKKIYSKDESDSLDWPLPYDGLELNELVNQYKAFKKAVISLGQKAGK